jgi:hypothetical protein
MNGHPYSPVLCTALVVASFLAVGAMAGALAGIVYDRLTGGNQP